MVVMRSTITIEEESKSSFPYFLLWMSSEFQIKQLSLYQNLI